jgi:hypothetical protein
MGNATPISPFERCAMPYGGFHQFSVSACGFQMMTSLKVMVEFIPSDDA